MEKTIDSRLIGQTIRTLRLKNNLTQDVLAELIGYSARNIRRIENHGTTNIEVVNTFAEFFNVSAFDILRWMFFIYQDKIDNKQHKYKFCRIFLIFFLI